MKALNNTRTATLISEAPLTKTTWVRPRILPTLVLKKIRKKEKN